MAQKIFVMFAILHASPVQALFRMNVISVKARGFLKELPVYVLPLAYFTNMEIHQIIFVKIVMRIAKPALEQLLITAHLASMEGFSSRQLASNHVKSVIGTLSIQTVVMFVILLALLVKEGIAQQIAQNALIIFIQMV